MDCEVKSERRRVRMIAGQVFSYSFRRLKAMSAVWNPSGATALVQGVEVLCQTASEGNSKTCVIRSPVLTIG